RVRIKMTRASVCMEDDRYAPHGAVIGMDSDSSLSDFIRILIERYCPKIKGRDLIWVLSYHERHLAVFNGTTGSTNIINDNMINMTMQDIVKEDNNPAMYLHYLSQSSIEDTAKTMFINNN
ncbi:MAG: hypothetical protein ACI398_03875, partial [Clostridium sp.]